MKKKWIDEAPEQAGTFRTVITLLFAVSSCAGEPQVAPQSAPAGHRLEAAKQDEREAAEFCDKPPWSHDELVQSKRQLSQQGQDIEPEDVYPMFKKLSDLRTSFEQLGCASRPSAAAWEWDLVDSIWLGITERAASKARIVKGTTLAKEERAILARFDEDFAVAKQVARTEEARKRGFVEVRVGLGVFLQEVRDTGMSLGTVRKHLILLGPEDEQFKVLQVLGATALFVDDEDLRVFVEGAADRLYEGTPLRAVASHFQVTGTRSYESLGGTRQAFVLKSIADLNLDGGPLLSLLGAYEHNGLVSMAEYVDRQLAECSDLPAPVFQQMIGAFGDLQAFDASLRGSQATLLLKERCETAFSREPTATCTIPKGSQLRAYPRPPKFDGLDETFCLKNNGKWVVSDLVGQ